MDIFSSLKNQKKMGALTNHKVPTKHPTGRAGWRRAGPTASPSRSIARDSPDPDVNSGKVPGSCRRRGRAGSSCDPPELCFRRTRAERVARIRGCRFSFVFEAPSTLLSWSCSHRLASGRDRSPLLL